MQVREIMTCGVEVIRPDSTLQEAAQKMKMLDVGPLPVCDGQRLVGMITDRDITVRGVAEGRDPRSTPVGEGMTPEVHFCFDDDDVAEAARLMKEKEIRRLLVLNRDKHLVGVLSLGDLAVCVGDQQISHETLERVSEPAIPHP